MKRQVIAVLLATVVAIPVLAGARTLVRLEGWIVDSYCGAKNANAEAAEETIACHKKGAKLILITADGTSYDLEDQERALQHVGRAVHVFALVDKDRNLKIGKYIGSDETDLTKGPANKGERLTLLPQRPKPEDAETPSEPRKDESRKDDDSETPRDPR